MILCEDWNEAQVKAFRLMANRSARWSEFDLQLVALELQELQGLDFNLALTGFDGVEIDQLLCGEQAELDELVAELVQEPISRLGDLWQFHSHRVLCDALKLLSPVPARVTGDTFGLIGIINLPTCSVQNLSTSAHLAVLGCGPSYRRRKRMRPPYQVLAPIDRYHS